MHSLRTYATALVAVASLASTTSLHAVEIRVTVRNLSPTDSVALSPIILAAHDGSVDLFTAGTAAIAGVENVAELGSVGATLQAEVAAAQPTAVTLAGVATSGGFGPGILVPGASASHVLSLDPTDNRYFSFLAMVVPSNDSFIGNDNPTGIELFDAGGNFVASNFQLTGGQIWDAGTEVNGLTGAAYIAGSDAMLGAEENGVVHLPTTLNEQFGEFLGLQTAPGGTFNTLPALNAGFVSFEFSVVPEPATWVLALTAGGFALVWWRRR